LLAVVQAKSLSGKGLDSLSWPFSGQKHDVGLPALANGMVMASRDSGSLNIFRSVFCKPTNDGR